MSRLTIFLIPLLLISCSGQKTENNHSLVDNENDNHSAVMDSHVKTDTIYSYHDNGEMRSLATVKNDMKQGRALMFNKKGKLKEYRYYDKDELRYAAYYENEIFQRFGGYPIANFYSELTDKTKIQFDRNGKANFEVVLVKPVNVEMVFEIEEHIDSVMISTTPFETVEDINSVEYELINKNTEQLVLRYSHKLIRDDESYELQRTCIILDILSEPKLN